MKAHFSRLSRNVLVYGIGGSLNRVIAMLLLPFMTAHLAPSDYGIAAILGIVSMLATSIFALGLGSVIGAYYFDKPDPEHRGSVIWTATIMLVASALALALFGAILSGQISIWAFGTDFHARLVLITILTASLSILIVPLILYCQFEEKLLAYQFITIGSSLLTSLCILTLVVFMHRGIDGMVEGGFYAHVATAVLLFSFAPRPPWRFARRLALTMVRAGVCLVPGFFFLFFLSQSSKYILQRSHGLEATGLLSIGVSLTSVLGLAVGAFSSAWTPFFMSFVNRREEAAILFGRILLYFVYFFGGLTLVVAFLIRPAVLILTAPAFHAAYQPAIWAASVHFFTGVFSIFLPPVYFAKDVPKVTLVQSAAAAAALLVNFTLIPTFGALGAGMALSAGYAIMALLTWGWNSLKGNAYFVIHYPRRRIASFFPIYVVFLVVASWGRQLPLLPELGIAAAACVSLPLILYALLDRNERAKGWQVIWEYIDRARSFKPTHDSVTPERQG